MKASVPSLVVSGALLYFGSKREKGALRSLMMVGGVLGLAGAFAGGDALEPPGDGARAILQGRAAKLRTSFLTPTV